MQIKLSEKRRITRPVIVLIFTLLITYLLIRTVFIAYAKYSSLEKVLAVLFLISEAFVIFHAFGYLATLFRLSKRGTEGIKTVELNEFPEVSVLIPARHEPKEILEGTVVSCYNIDYPNIKVYILDDSSEESYKREAEELALKYKANLYRRASRHGAKAGIINDCVKTLGSKYVVIFDVDQNPMPNFLVKLMPIIEADPRLALVQTPQFYSNLGSAKVAFASEMQQAVFYEYICEGKSSHQAMICCGTNVLIRREALLDVGGMDESTVTEDFATSFRLHRRGWKTLYYNKVNTFGEGPSDIGAYFRQQKRWAMGNITVLKTILRDLLFAPRGIGPMQWLEYLITGSYYLIGWTYVFLIFCPIIYIFFNIPSFFMNPVVYSFTFFPYLVLSLVVFYESMGERKYKALQVIKGQLLSFLTLPVFMSAAIGGIIGKKRTFQVTSKVSGGRVSYFTLWPQITFWAVNLAAITWGLERYFYERTAAVFVNVAWIVYHFLLLSSVFYFNED